MNAVMALFSPSEQTIILIMSKSHLECPQNDIWGSGRQFMPKSPFSVVNSPQDSAIHDCNTTRFVFFAGTKQFQQGQQMKLCISQVFCMKAATR